MNRSRLTSRDYKSARAKNGLAMGRWREFAWGLGIGLAVALIVYVSDHRQAAPGAEAQPVPRAKSTTKTAAEAEEPVAQYDFYDMLPKFEVVVPEKDREVRRDLPAAKVERPGVYVLQAGSYRNQVDAQRVATQLGKQGIEAKVQRVAVDADVWHRVRVGPINNLDQVNKLRTQLRAADFDALVIRVGD